MNVLNIIDGVLDTDKSRKRVRSYKDIHLHENKVEGNDIFRDKEYFVVLFMSEKKNI